ncbi:DUF116 domain-containing protein [Ruminiclostridium herbifermentans]|uniref:DUF116 domain-containing protein n=1 Tax=Ruminiclostridium herbifermentans TaxID=2488810 RepID=UPI001FD0050E|nr:DUF116 domain-containing protein [Ruminiclostridium herbifermentans]
MEQSNIKAFIRATLIILAAFTALLVLFCLAYRNASINDYNKILILLIAAISICMFLAVLMSVAIAYTYKRKKTDGIFLVLTKLGMLVLLPLVLLLEKANNNTKRNIQHFYIELNNILVDSDNKRYRAQDIMLLLPHCLQNNECNIKVTNDSKLCKHCGRCKIGALLEFAEQKNISIFIATGGTVARNIIKKIKPKLIISVACERDLMSGIADVRGIPVVGVVNKTPNGPCFNTDVDIDAIKKRVEQLSL